MLRPAVFLDRDRTLILPKGDGVDLQVTDLVQGAAAAIASIRGLGYKIVIVTNEDGVADGKVTEADVEAKHTRLRELIEAKTTGAHVDAFCCCLYKPRARVKAYAKAHPDRIPKPGLWEKSAEELGIDLSKSWTIGHEKTVCQAGKNAGTRTIHLNPVITGRAHPDQPGGKLDYAVGTLIEAARVIAQQRKPEAEESNRPSNKRWDKARIAELQRPREGGSQVYQPAGNKPFRPLDLPAQQAAEAAEAAEAEAGNGNTDNAVNKTEAAATSSQTAKPAAANATDSVEKTEAQAATPAKKVRRVKKATAKKAASKKTVSKSTEAGAEKPAEADGSQAAKVVAESKTASESEPADKAAAEAPVAKASETTAGKASVDAKSPAKSPETSSDSKPAEAKTEPASPAKQTPQASEPAAKAVEASPEPVAADEVKPSVSTNTNTNTTANAATAQPAKTQPAAAASQTAESKADAQERQAAENVVAEAKRLSADAAVSVAKQTRLESSTQAKAAAPTVVVSNQETERLLRQLLQETRNRKRGGDVGPMDMFAMGVEFFAVVCMVGGLVMGGESTLQWFACGLFLQGATIAIVLFSRR